MIDYAVLCRAIEDWKAGHAPRVTASRPPPRPSRPVSAPVAVEPEVEAEEPVEEIAEQQAPEDRTIIYAMPEIVDEGEGDVEGEAQVDEES